MASDNATSNSEILKTAYPLKRDTAESSWETNFSVVPINLCCPHSMLYNLSITVTENRQSNG